MTGDLAQLPDRIRSKVDGSGTCWLWTAASTTLGYGCVYWEGRQQMAHRVIWELLIGPIPAGFETDHLCRNPSCVNPAHLEMVTHGENMRRSTAAAKAAEHHRSKTHCPAGHPYDEDNTYHFTSRSGGAARGCKACRRIQSTESARRRRHRERV